MEMKIYEGYTLNDDIIFNKFSQSIQDFGEMVLPEISENIKKIFYNIANKYKTYNNVFKSAVLEENSTVSDYGDILNIKFRDEFYKKSNIFGLLSSSTSPLGVELATLKASTDISRDIDFKISGTKEIANTGANSNLYSDVPISEGTEINESNVIIKFPNRLEKTIAGTSTKESYKEYNENTSEQHSNSSPQIFAEYTQLLEKYNIYEIIDNIFKSLFVEFSFK